MNWVCPFCQKAQIVIKDQRHTQIGALWIENSKYKKPTFVLEEMGVSHEGAARASGGGDKTLNSPQSEEEGYTPSERNSHEAKGSARSYGDFSAADAIRAADDKGVQFLAFGLDGQ